VNFGPGNFSDFVQVTAYAPAIEARLGRSMLDMRVDAEVLSPDGRYVAIGGCTVNKSGSCTSSNSEGDSFLYLLDARTGVIAEELPVTDTSIASLAFTSDGKKLIYAVKPVRIVVWDLSVGAAERIIYKNVNIHAYPDVAVSPDDSMIAAVFDDQLMVWSTDGDLLAQKPAIAWSHYLPQFSPDGRFLAVCSRDGGRQVTIYDTADWHRISSINPPGLQTSLFVFTPDSGLLLTAQDAKNTDILFWDTANGEAAGSIDVPFDNILTAVFPPGGGLLLVSGLTSGGGLYDSIAVWDFASREQLGTVHSMFFPDRIQFSADGSSFLYFYWPFAYLWSLPDENAAAARRSAEGFLSALREGDYGGAASLLRMSDENAAYFDSIGLNSSDASAVLESLCSASAQPCRMPLEEILYEGIQDDGMYAFLLNMTAPDGSTYTDARGDEVFNLYVEKDGDGHMRVTVLPSFLFGE
jgi:WD40 repeat protein